MINNITINFRTYYNSILRITGKFQIFYNINAKKWDSDVSIMSAAIRKREYQKEKHGEKQSDPTKINQIWNDIINVALQAENNDDKYIHLDEKKVAEYINNSKKNVPLLNSLSYYRKSIIKPTSILCNDDEIKQYLFFIVNLFNKEDILNIFFSSDVNENDNINDENTEVKSKYGWLESLEFLNNLSHEIKDGKVQNYSRSKVIKSFDKCIKLSEAKHCEHLEFHHLIHKKYIQDKFLGKKYSDLPDNDKILAYSMVDPNSMILCEQHVHARLFHCGRFSKIKHPGNLDTNGMTILDNSYIDYIKFTSEINEIKTATNKKGKLKYSLKRQSLEIKKIEEKINAIKKYSEFTINPINGIYINKVLTTLDISPQKSYTKLKDIL
ncbi:MAG: hypothetical protein LBS76_03710 [Mycoplasmataceae bacterium]|nr:hypothetical protein [Mycoplasmataceae bacterium]